MKYFIQSLTLFRIISAPLIFLIITLYEYYGWALILLLLASLSDYWDGYLARKYNLESVLGEILDPIADKILIVFIVVALTLELSSLIFGFMGSLILAREFWVGALRVFNSRNDNSHLTKVTFLAKIKTTLQLMTFCIFLIGLYLNNALILFSANFLLFLALIVTIQTGLSYTFASFRN